MSKKPTRLQPERLNNDMLKKERYLKKEALSTAILFQISAESKTESESDAKDLVCRLSDLFKTGR